MNNPALTLRELHQRWEEAMVLTEEAVNRHPEVYRELKSLIEGILVAPLDIRDYFSTAEKIVLLLKQLDPGGRGSIFHRFTECLAPSTIWHVRWMRVECTDLMDHLKAFDQWRREKCRLKLVK